MEALAIDGGPKVISESLPPEWPGLNWVDEEEEKLVLAALHGTAFGGTLEEDLRAFYGCPVAAATNSGTGALFTATAAVGLQPGMEVLVPGFAWIPTYGCIVARGAIPVLVEVGEDLGLDPQDLERKITARTAAVMAVHMCGGAANMDAIMEVAGRRNLLVIEDCAQDGAGQYRGQFVGLIGDLGCFSLQQNKHFTSFVGGYVLSRRPDLGHAVHLSRDAGMSRVMDVVSHEVEEDVRWGLGRSLGPLAQAMARAQLTKAPRIIASMQRSQARIRGGLGDLPGLRFRPLDDPESDCGSFLVTYWPDRQTAAAAAEALKAEGVPPWTFHLEDYGTHMYYHVRPLVERVGWTRGGPCPWDCPLNEGADHSYEKGALPASDAIFSRGVVMAVPSRLTGEQCDLIVAAYRKVAAHLL